MTDLYYPLRSLREGHWFKLICGASFQHLPAIRSLVLAYTLAGADCIDVAADPAVILTAKAAIKLAANFVAADDRGRSPTQASPWLMVSLNDGEDPHFRKAEFDPKACPLDCDRPCERICPTQAIVFQPTSPTVRSLKVDASKRDASRRLSASAPSAVTPPSTSGVVSDRCYGCGRCLPVCPIQQIATRSYGLTPEAIALLVLQTGVDAIEIHTRVGHLEAFRRLWQAIAPCIGNLKLVAISCPDGEGLFDYLRALHDVISPLPCALLWQMDGRPMSGDIGIGATRAAVKLGQKALTAGLPGYVQVAGGTNKHTVPKLKALGLLQPHLLDPSVKTKVEHHTQLASYVSGVAYGSYARTLLMPVLNQIDAIAMPIEPVYPSIHMPHSASLQASGLSTHGQQLPAARSRSLGLEESPALLREAVALAHSLVSQLKPCTSSQRIRLDL